MSRTFRRRHDLVQRRQEIDRYFEPLPIAGERRWVYDIATGWRGVSRPNGSDARAFDTGKIRHRLIADFHGEIHPGARNAPAWFRRIHNVRNRRLDQKAILRALDQGEDDIVIPIHRRSASWDWF